MWTNWQMFQIVVVKMSLEECHVLKMPRTNMIVKNGTNKSATKAAIWGRRVIGKMSQWTSMNKAAKQITDDQAKKIR